MPGHTEREATAKGQDMIVLGLVLLVLGYLLVVPVLVTIGWVLAGIGLILLLITTVGHREIMGRRYWY
jgi:hypothetical protein